MTKASKVSVTTPKKRVLNNTKRLKLLTFATTKFIAVRERAAEAKAKAKIVELFKAFHAKEVVPALPTLRKFGACKNINAIWLPSSRNVLVDVKDIEAPSGKMIKREIKENFARPTDPRDHVFSNASEFKGMMLGHYVNAYQHVSALGLGAWFEFPAGFGVGGANNFAACSGNDRIYDENGKCNGSFMPERFNKAVEAYYIAAARRLEAERKLHSTIAKIIDASAHFEDLIEVWPEAKTIETDLFSSEAKPVFAIVALSDDDKALLCANMKSRGVKAAACSFTPALAAE